MLFYFRFHLINSRHFIYLNQIKTQCQTTTTTTRNKLMMKIERKRVRERGGFVNEKDKINIYYY